MLLFHFTRDFRFRLLHNNKKKAKFLIFFCSFALNLSFDNYIKVFLIFTIVNYVYAQICLHITVNKKKKKICLHISFQFPCERLFLTLPFFIVVFYAWGDESCLRTKKKDESCPLYWCLICTCLHNFS